MSANALNLDHVAVVVRDLDDGYRRYSKLGFSLTRASSHQGPVEPGGEVELWGTGNHCAMFKQGYLEVLGITDPDRYKTHVDERLARHEGLHLVAFGCAGAATLVNRLKLKVRGLDDPVTIQREVPFGEATRLGEFSIAHLDDEIYPEADFFLIEHQTPDILWQPALMCHPNGALELVSTTICTADPAAAMARLTPLLGAPGPDGFALQRGWLIVVDADEFLGKFPGAKIPPLPCAASLRIEVRDLKKTQRVLDGNAISYERTQGGTIWVRSDYCNGAIVEFSERQMSGAAHR